VEQVHLVIIQDHLYFTPVEAADLHKILLRFRVTADQGSAVMVEKVIT
jgi:hypothetical protein